MGLNSEAKAPGRSARNLCGAIFHISPFTNGRHVPPPPPHTHTHARARARATLPTLTTAECSPILNTLKTSSNFKNIKETTDQNAIEHCAVPMLKKMSRQ